MKKTFFGTAILLFAILIVNLHSGVTSAKGQCNFFQTRSIDLPSIGEDGYHDLSESDYNADLSIVGKDKLYTNKWFRSNGDKKIYVDYNVKSNSEKSNMYVGLYSITKHKVVTESDALSVSTNSTKGTVTFMELNPAHKYVIYFRAHPKSVDGSVTIRH